jgi:hypothetical protein
MTYRHKVVSPKSTIVGCALLLSAACSSSTGTTAGGKGGESGTGGISTGGSNGSGGTTSSSSGGAAGSSKTGGTTGSGGNAGVTGSSSGGAAGSGKTGGTTGSGQGGTTAIGGGGQTAGTGGNVAGASGNRDAGAASGGAAGTGPGGTSGGSGGQAGGTGTAGQAGSPGIDAGVLTSSCTGKTFPTADPTKPGPFQTTSEKNVGPAAGYTPDPVYGDQQQKFNIYRPKDLADGYCHPIVVWSNGHGDNPEQNGPCVIDKAADKWCGQYKPVLDHLASHGFVVIASLSTTTSKSDPTTGSLPSIVGLEWLLKEAENPNNKTYYHTLDTAHIGAFGHSEGGMATCMMAKDPRFSAISTVSGTSTINTIYAPAVFFCGGQETNFDPPMCDSNLKVASTITSQPAGLFNAKDEDHGSWAYDGASGVAISGFAAWFRLHLMGDTAQRKRFYGDNCTFCTDNRVKVLYRNDLMSQ